LERFLLFTVIGCGDGKPASHQMSVGYPRKSPHGDHQIRPTKHNYNYELFNHNNFSIRSWSWNYRGCWHQTCPPVDPR